MPPQLLLDLFQAYFDAQKNKKRTRSAIEFEMNFEVEIFRLYDEIVSRRYEISASTCFISFYPVKREIFAGAFRDRIVHHLVFNYLNPFCERIFINDTYSCRKGKGTSYGVARANHFVRSCSGNYQKDCYVLKLDIAGYFMSISKNILFLKIEKLIEKFEKEITFDKELFLWLIRKIIFNDPTKNCFVKGKKSEWVGLPKSKSLFFSRKNSGLPIGNLTSQLFANLYLNDFDHFIKCKLKCHYYGRYVDDLLFVSPNKQFLSSLYCLLDEYLWENLSLHLHKKKIYFQHFKKGFVFLGRIILPHRIYLKNRIKSNLYQKVEEWKIIYSKEDVSEEEKTSVKSSQCSYHGMLLSCNAFKLRKKLRKKLQESGIEWQVT